MGLVIGRDGQAVLGLHVGLDVALHEKQELHFHHSIDSVSHSFKVSVKYI